ncbi:MAG: cytochrome c peroxidase [Pirellulaceae bacterium]|nr:cytochrome c peroxidase [Pirellulaceae bacterium]
MPHYISPLPNRRTAPMMVSRFLISCFCCNLALASVLAAQESSPPADLSHPFMQVDLSPKSSPVGIPEVETLSPEQLQIVNLGRRLFFDPALSVDGSTSCATCHRPEHGFSSPLKLPKGVADREAKRHAPAILNRHLGTIQFWDGRMETLEEQALQPIETENELDNSIDAVLKMLSESDEYRKSFDAAFEDGVTKQNLAKAIAGFERALITAESPIDRFVTARESVLTKSQRQGLWLYESKGGCWQCHTGQNYSDEKFHNTGVSWGVGDLGREEHTGDDSHTGQFKTPTLRNVALTGPYMHDGSIKTLREVVEFYNKGGTNNPHLDTKMKPLELTEQEIGDLVEFLKALEGRYIWESPEQAESTSELDSSGEE